MASIKITDLTFAYAGCADNVFEHVSLTLDTDWKTGLVGRNGRGKTTLLRLLRGDLPHGGAIVMPVRCEYFPYGVTERHAPVVQAVAALVPEAEEWEIERELALVGLGREKLDLPFACLSAGEKVKAEIAAMFLRGGAFPLIDEPTNHLDAGGRRSLAAYLARKRGYIVVSHDRAFLDGCVDHILSINRTDIEVRKGDFSAWLADIEAREAGERARNEKLGREIERLRAATDRTAAWSAAAEKAKFGVDRESTDRGFLGHKAAKIMKRAKATEQRQEKAIAARSALLQNTEYSGELALDPLPAADGPLASLANVSVSYGDRTVISGVSLTVNKGARIAVRGANGSGKSSLLSLLCGDDIAFSGSVWRRSGLVISRLRQVCDFGGTPEEYAARAGADVTRFFTVLAKLGFDGKDRTRAMTEISDGQRKKVMLAAALCVRAHLYVWDEPLNFIDVISRVQIERALPASGATLVFVEHDDDFVRAVATETLEL